MGQELSGRFSKVSLDLTNQSIASASLQQLSLPLCLDVVSFSSDVVFTKEEFDYLVGIKSGDIVDEGMLLKALEYVQAKNKFSSVVLSINTTVQGEHELHFDFSALWTFDKVKFQGPLQDKDRYRAYYLLEAGEVFSLHKHAHSLEKVKEALRNEGFFEAQVDSYLDYITETKTVAVTIIIDPKNQFFIQEVNLQLIDSEITQQELIYLTKKAQDELRRRLINRAYSQEKLSLQTLFLKKYLARRGFSDAIIKVHRFLNHDTGRVIIDMQATISKKRKFVFFGNHYFSKYQLLEMFETFGSAASFVPDTLLQAEIVQTYKAKGFFNVDVAVHHGDDGCCLFMIQEGEQARLELIEVVSDSLSLALTGQAMLRRLIGAKQIEQELIKDACAQLVQLYIKHGFWDAKIIGQEYVPVCEGLSYNLKIEVQEGIQRKLASVTVQGFTNWQGHPPRELSIQTHEIFDLALIARQRQALMNYFHERGYLYLSLKHELIPDPDDPCLLHLIWHVGGSLEQVHFGKVVVQGSTTFPFTHLVREMAFKEGDIWRQELVRESLSRLLRLTIFESVYLYPDQVEKAQPSKMVIAKVVHDDPFELRLRFGFQQVSKTFLAFRKGTTYKIGGSFLYKNPTNAGDTIRLDADVTRFYRNISGVYQRPWLTTQPIRTILKGYSNKYIQPVFIGSDKPLYQATQQGFLVGLRRRWPLVDLGMTIGNEWMETNHLSRELARAINFEPVLIDKKVPYICIEPDIALNSLDNQLNPTSGLLTIFSVKMMLPWQRLQPTQGFLRLIFDQSIFFPLSSRIVLGWRFRFGHIFNKDFNRIMPPERFYLGGQNSIRSYQPDFGPPLGLFIEKDGKRQPVPRGGRSVVAMNCEVRCIVWGNLGLVIFQDVGTLIDSLGIEGGIGHLIAGTGFGLRYNTPIGPVRFDIGWKWKKYYPEESRYAWFLTLGHAF